MRYGVIVRVEARDEGVTEDVVGGLDGVDFGVARPECVGDCGA